MRSVLILVLCALLCQQCTLQKRKYQDGYYLSFAGKHKRNNSAETSLVGQTGLVANTHYTQPTQALNDQVAYSSSNTVLASIDHKTPPLLRRKSAVVPPDTCDVVMFRTGEEIKAKVSEITPTEVKYRKCSMPDGPLFSNRRTDIYMIRYANGTKQVFEMETPSARSGTAVAATGAPARHPDATIALVLGILGWIPFLPTSIAAIVVGNHVLRDIRREPRRYTGTGEARAAVILGWTKVALVAFYLLIVLILIYSWV